VVVVRQFEDYIVIPRVMGHVTGLAPLVLVSVSAIGLLFGGFYVLMATPFVALIATLVDVIVRDKLTGGAGRADRAVREGVLGFSPAAEDQPAQSEAETERSDRERADRDGLAPRREALPPPDRLLFFGRQRFAATLLAHGAASSQTEVEVVEDLGGFVGHDFSV
jgi:hypothetical protein